MKRVALPSVVSNSDTSRRINMKNSSLLPSYDENIVDSKFSFLKPVARTTVAKYALEKFENAHITIFQVK